MIKQEKLKTLKTDTFYKKASLLLSSAICRKTTLSDAYIEEIILRLRIENPDDSELIDRIKLRIATEGLLVLKDYIDLKADRIEADFDFISDNGSLNADKRIVKDRYLLLDGLRSPYNLGSIIRSAESFKIKEIILVDSSIDLNHPKVLRTSLNCLSILPCKCFNKSAGIEYAKSLNLSMFALECGGEDIDTYNFPDSAICVVGSEEFGISESILSLCKDKITIKTYGAKGSLNVSVATAIMLSRWSTV